MRVRRLLWVLGFALVAILGYWLAGTAAPRKESRETKQHPPETARQTAPADDPLPKFRRGLRLPTGHGDSDALAAGALEGQRVLVFKDQAALARFLERAGDRIRLMGRLDALNALRVGFSNYDDLLALLDGDEEQSFIFPVSIPDLPQGSVQPGAVPIGSHLLDWLGITVDNSNWGKGILIAILDTGVTANSAFKTSITQINLVPLPADLSKQNGHGTAVASMIIGNDPLTPGVAPSTSILSIRVADDNGGSNTFVLAQGIIAAVDAGAKGINISLGGFGDSAVLRSAVQYAIDRGVLVFAAAGNNGINQVAKPAAYPGVIAVGAADGVDNHLDFSNTGDQVAISGPGLGINAAWSNDQAASVTGTSPATPAVLGVTVGVATEKNIPLSQAYQQIAKHADDTGAPGKDPVSGVGTPNIGRVLNADTPGIYDAALASQTIVPPDASHPYGQVEILVENRGTEPLVNTAVKVSTGGGVTTMNLTSIAPDAEQTVLVPITQPPTSASSGFTIDSKVVLSSGLIDAQPSNDRRVESYVPAGNQ
jgi:hypothetical protein